jgi:VWFA-related protein
MRWTKCWKSSARQDSLIKLIVGLLLFSLGGAAAFAQEPTFRSQSNIVLVPALVRDAQGHAVYGLQAKDFIVEDNGVPQKARLDEDVEGEPLSIVVAIQTGRSAEREFPRIRGLSSMLGPILEEPRTRVAIVEFDSQVRLMQNFTPDATQIQRALEGIEGGDGRAAILSAVRYSAELLNQLPGQQQRVILLVSETRDHGSRGMAIDDIITLIGNSNISVYALAFSPGLGDMINPYRGDSSHQGPEYIAALLLARAAMKRNMPKAVAAQTGGEYETFSTLNAFENHLVDFTNHLHSRYLLSFQPQNPEPGLHRIAVRLVNPQGNTVLARETYWPVGSGTDLYHEDVRSEFAGTWKGRINPATGKAAITFNIAVTEGIAGGTAVLVNQDGKELTSAILNPELSGRMLRFDSVFENGAKFSWHLSLDKSGDQAKVQGNSGPMVIEEVLFKQPQ